MGQRWWLFGRRDQPLTDHPLKEELARRGVRMFTYEALRIATQDFTTRIGIGGFSNVYLGILDDESRVAIKVGINTSGTILKGIEVMSGIHHRNLNRIIGCCVDQGAQMVVSEYIENGTLYDLIGDTHRRRTIFNWKKRLSLCIEIARGISFLHEEIHPRVIHRDIKPGNILLDTNLSPKICDFELLGFVHHEGDLPLEDGVKGTLGYLDPDYLYSSQYTEKVDVYAFGVVMLEVISGRRAIQLQSDDHLLCEWASKLVSEDRTLEVVDPLLADFSNDAAVRFINVALLCTRRKPEERPSMKEVQLMLTGVSVQEPGEQEANNIYAQIQEIESCTEQESTQQGQAASSEVRVQQQKPWMRKKKKMPIQVGIAPSGSTDLAERLSRTMVFKKKDCPEAVYPPYHTRVFRGSRILYSFDI